VFKPYQINQNLVSEAKDDGIIFHYLLANRREEIAYEVIDSPHSAVIDKSESRLDVRKTS